MERNILKRNASRIYLILVPFLTSAMGLGVGYVSYKIYLPVWIINVCLMVWASFILSAPVFRTQDKKIEYLAASALFLIVPWIFISIIGGLGRPPFGNPKEWIATETEQEIRYIVLILAGVLYAFGFAILREKFRNTSGDFYSLLGFTAILIAIPLFIMDMTFLNYYVARLYGIMSESGLDKTPEWAKPTANQFNFIPVIVSSLIFISTAAFAAALKTTGRFNPASCNIYIAISLLGFLLTVLPNAVPEPLAIASFIATIPAVPFFMPYLMGINLLNTANQPKDHRV
jgi:hypothetical protein